MLVKMSHGLDDKWIVVTKVQEKYKLARAIKVKHHCEFYNAILLLGRFHQAHNCEKAICKIIRDSGAVWKFKKSMLGEFTQYSEAI